MTQWPAWRRQWAWEDIDAAQAFVMWKSPESGHLTSAQLHDLVLLATGSKERAEQEMAARADSRMARNLEP